MLEISQNADKKTDGTYKAKFKYLGQYEGYFIKRICKLEKEIAHAKYEYVESPLAIIWFVLVLIAGIYFIFFVEWSYNEEVSIEHEI